MRSPDVAAAIRRHLLQVLLPAVALVPLLTAPPPAVADRAAGSRGLPVAAAAPAGLALQPSAVPKIELAAPQEVLVGEDYHLQLTFANAGIVPGYGPYIELWLPAGGEDGSTVGPPCDGLTFVSAVATVGQTSVALATGPLGFAPINPLTLEPHKHILSDPGVNLACPGLGLTARVYADATHPYYVAGSTPTMLPQAQGWPHQLVVLELPQGSVMPVSQGTPPIPVDVTVHLSNLADATAGGPVSVWARGGFRYGTTAANDPGTDPLIEAAAPKWADSYVNVMQLGLEDPLLQPGSCADGVDNGPDGKTDILDADCNDKVYAGPEDEAATGPNLTGVYPLQYTMSLNIADGQTLNALSVIDDVPPGLTITAVSATPTGYTISKGLPFSGGGSIAIAWPGPIQGTAAPSDVTVTLTFEVDDILDPATCQNIDLENNVHVDAVWTPLDPRDDDLGVSTGWLLPVPDHVLTAKCLPVQKQVVIETDVAPPGVSPGDTLRYLIDFQVPDTMAFGNLVIEDVLGDGQRYVPGQGPTLSVSDRHGVANEIFQDGQWLTIAPTDKVCQGLTGGTLLTFDVTQQLMAAGLPLPPPLASGVVSGGHVYAPTAAVPGRGRIAYRAVVEDQFAQPQHQPGDEYVVKHDPLPNCVTVTGERYDVADPLNISATDVIATDTSGTLLVVPGGPFVKTIAAHNGVPVPAGTVPQVAPGDTLTFRLEKTFPTGDAEQVIVRDFLPLPVLAADDPDADLTTGPNWTFDPTTAPTAPGMIGFLPGHNLPSGAPNPPSTSPGKCGAEWHDIANNSLCLDFGNIHDPTNQSRTLAIGYTVRVTAQPYPDALTYASTAVETEANSFGTEFAAQSAASFVVTQPVLRITKGIVAASNPYARYVPAPPAPGSVTFVPPQPFGACPGRFTGPLTSAALLANPVDSDVYAVDRFDWVTFAIVVENIGSGLNGAFDVQLSDLLPIELRPYNSLCVYDGHGNVRPNTDLSGGLFGAGIELGDPGNTTKDLGSLDHADATSADNVAVITFNSRIRPDVAVGCYQNEATLLHYASVEGGPDHVAAGFGQPHQDVARACIQPAGDKLVRRTSVPQTMPDNTSGSTGAPADVTIGEVVRFRLELVIPEGLLPAFEIRDALPDRLAYLDDGTATWGLASSTTGGIVNPAGIANYVPSSGEPVSNFPAAHAIAATPLPGTSFSACAASGDTPVFAFGDLNNTENDPDPEHLILEFNALVCNADTNADAPGKRAKVNVATFHSAGKDAGASGPATMRVVEPHLTVTKDVTGTVMLGSNSLHYTVVIENDGTAPAFDVAIQDIMPTCLDGLVVSSVDVKKDQAWGDDKSATTASALHVAVDEIAVQGVVTITFEVEPVCTNCAELANTVHVTWTSLTGDQGIATGQAGNATGSTTPGASGDPNGERRGDGAAVNTYASQDSASPCGTICGTKWHDMDGDGQQTGGEGSTHLPWEIEVRDPQTGAVMGMELTNTDDGTYCVGPLLPGTYEVGELAQPGWIQTAPPAPGTHTVVLTAGGTVTGVDFGNAEQQSPGPLPILLPFTCNQPGCQSGIQVQSLENINVIDAQGNFFNQTGSSVETYWLTNIQPRTAKNFWLPGLTPPLSLGVHAAQIGPTGKARALTRADWPAVGSAAMYNDVGPGLEVIVPLVTRGDFGHTSTVTVQNTDVGAAATVKAELFPGGAAKSWTINAGRSFTIDLTTDPAFAGVAAGYRGAMRVTSTTPLGVESHGVVAPWPKATYAFEGSPVGDASDTLYAPLFRNDYYGTTDITVANPGLSAVNVTVTYYGANHPQNALACQGATFNHGPVTIPAASTATFDQSTAGGSGLPTGCFGAATIRATGGKVLAVVRDMDPLPRTTGAYIAVAAEKAGMDISLPLFRSNHTFMQLYTGISAMNTGLTTALVSVQVFDSAGNPYMGCGAACTATVAPNETAVFWPGTMMTGGKWILPGGEYGSAIVTSTEPLAIIVNDSALLGGIDSAIYNGIKAD